MSKPVYMVHPLWGMLRVDTAPDGYGRTASPLKAIMLAAERGAAATAK